MLTRLTILFNKQQGTIGFPISSKNSSFPQCKYGIIHDESNMLVCFHCDLLGGNTLTWKSTYDHWNGFTNLDKGLREQLNNMSSDAQQLEDAFYKNLSFGTGGMRGVLGPGTNRMNIYTVRKAVKGLAEFLIQQNQEAKSKGVVVAYDCRHMSKEFALETAKVLGYHGIHTYIYESLRPTPYLSFAVRYLKASAGVMITASHNPPEYNGFKVYNEDGGQMPPKDADDIISYVNQVKDELDVQVLDQTKLEDENLVSFIGDEVDQAYLKQLKTIVKNEEAIRDHAKDVRIVFTPLHGTSYKPVMDGLKQLGFQRVSIVEDQADPDPEFSTVESPNPEEHQAFEHAIQLGKEKDADLLIGTDPDADRLGVAVKDENGEYIVLSGNQLGSLMMDYVLSQTKPLPKDAQVIKTIVTSEMGRAIADHYNVSMLETLTGFKFIGEKMLQFDKEENGTFLFGYEESYGYLIGDFVRDKDAVQAAVLACEMAAYWRSKGKTLYEALHYLYDRHGYYIEGLESMTLKGKDGSEKINKIMEHFRSLNTKKFGPFAIHAMEDYQSSIRTEYPSKKTSPIKLPDANVIKFHLEQDSWCCLRPSGTEPKIKFYFGVKSDSKETSEERLEQLKADVVTRMQEVLED